MRVLHVSTWDVPCGIATYCANLVRALDDRGVRSDVYPLAAHRWPTFTHGDVTELQADIARQAARYDLVHFQHEHGLYGHAVSYQASVRTFGAILRLVAAAGRPTVTTFHTDPLGSRRVRHRLSVTESIRRWRRRTQWRRHVSRCFISPSTGTLAIAHTPTTRHALVRRGIPAATVHVVPHGCLPQRDLRIDACTAKQRLGLPESAIVLTMFGFVGGYKGHDVAVRALAQLPERFHLAICGGAHPEADDPMLSTVIRLVKELGLAHRVTITGWLPPAEAEIFGAATDICLAPYVDASLSASGAITWALASGKPTVASRIPAFQEICREHPCLMLATPSDVEELVWAVEKLAADPQLGRELVAAAGDYTQRFSWEATAAMTQELYAALLAGESPAPAGMGRSRIVVRPDTGRAVGSADAPRLLREPASRRRAAAG